MWEATNRAVTTLDAKYKKANLPQVVHENCKHLTMSQWNCSFKLLLEFEELFDGTLGDWKTEPVKFQLKPGTAPYHGRAFPIPHIYLETLKKEVARLVKLGVLIKQPFSQWGAPTSIMLKKNGQVWVITDFREVNKRLIQTPYPIPKIVTML